MEALKLSSTKDEFVIRINRNSLDIKVLLDLIKQLQIETSIVEADFDPAIVDFGNHIKKEWWEKHKNTYLKGESCEDRD